MKAKYTRYSFMQSIHLSIGSDRKSGGNSRILGYYNHIRCHGCCTERLPCCAGCYVRAPYGAVKRLSSQIAAKRSHETSQYGMIMDEKRMHKREMSPRCQDCCTNDMPCCGRCLKATYKDLGHFLAQFTTPIPKIIHYKFYPLPTPDPLPWERFRDRFPDMGRTHVTGKRSSGLGVQHDDSCIEPKGKRIHVSGPGALIDNWIEDDTINSRKKRDRFTPDWDIKLEQLRRGCMNCCLGGLRCCEGCPTGPYAPYRRSE